jgi:hypothetical protein
MCLIRRVSVPAGETVKLIPPDGNDHSGAFKWEVLNPTGSGGAIELVDAADKSIGDGRPLAAGSEWDTLARDTSVFAAGPASGSAVVVIVTGTSYAD